MGKRITYSVKATTLKNNVISKPGHHLQHVKPKKYLHPSQSDKVFWLIKMKVVHCIYPRILMQLAIHYQAKCVHIVACVHFSYMAIKVLIIKSYLRFCFQQLTIQSADTAKSEFNRTK